ncbi:hypothetical protein OG21DRAFT_1331731 [Imleria badia]|nr:hypothetical protein OG21DRAFT_1331731 [Imleria badia]
MLHASPPCKMIPSRPFYAISFAIMLFTKAVVIVYMLSAGDFEFLIWKSSQEYIQTQRQTHAQAIRRLVPHLHDRRHQAAFDPGQACQACSVPQAVQRTGATHSVHYVVGGVFLPQTGGRDFVGGLLLDHVVQRSIHQGYKTDEDGNALSDCLQSLIALRRWRCADDGSRLAGTTVRNVTCNRTWQRV